MNRLLFALLAVASTRLTPHPVKPTPLPDRDEESSTSASSSSGAPGLTLLINRSLAGAKREELTGLRALERRLEEPRNGWPRHVALRVRVLARSLADEVTELDARCGESASSPQAERAQGGWTPRLTLDAETLSGLAATGPSLDADVATEVHREVHALLRRIRRQDDRLEDFERTILQPAREAYRSAAAGLGKGAAPMEVVDALELLAEKRESELALRVERELTLQALSELVGLDLRVDSPPPACPTAANSL